MQVSSVLEAHSTLEQPILHLTIIVIIMMSAILLLVTTLVITATIRFRHRATGAEPEQNFGNPKLELTWIILPFLLLVSIFVLMVITMHAADPSTTNAAGEDPPPDLIVVGHQFWWEIHYPGANVVAANEIHIPAGKRLLMRLEAADVIHDFWVPQLARKMDMIPGEPNAMWIEADHPGVYLGTCAEFCGNEHAWMRIRVIADSPKDFATWEAAQAQQPPPPRDPLAQHGKDLFQQMSCANCHAIAGVSDATIGPNLTHLASRQTLATGRMENNPVNLEAWLHDPEEYKPGTNMPNANLKSDELTAMVAYLETLR